jgi:hypothetical protein
MKLVMGFLVQLVPKTFQTSLRVSNCWGPSASEGPQKQDLTVFLEYNV